MSRKTILIVEDDVPLNMAFTKYLRARGYTIENAYSVESTLTHLKAAQAPDVVILDLGLVDGNSGPILKRLSEPRYEKTAVIIVSGSAFSREFGYAMPLNVVETLLKPVSPRALAALVNEITGTPAASPASAAL